MIPKIIYTCWFSQDGSIPDHIQHCINSQKIEGYSHKLLTLDNIPTRLPYINQCLESPFINKKWVKLTDYLRMHYLQKFGGIFLDADVEILKDKNFDGLLKSPLFIGKEMECTDGNNHLSVLGVAVIGAEPNHPLINHWIKEVETNFRGDDDKNYESSMDIINKIGVNYLPQMNILSPDYFYPYSHYTNETNISPNTIAVHHFNRAWTEYSTLQVFKENIEKNINFTFVKRGDGEQACMNGELGGNCDRHPYSKELADKLIESYKYLDKKAIIVDFDNQRDYNILLHRTDSDLTKISDFYKTIGKSNRPKYLIAPTKLYPIADLLNLKHIPIPEINAFASYKEILASIPRTKDAIYLFCAGMPTKVLIADLHPENPNATYLDCGSAFDPVISQTRTQQISTQQFIDLYRPNYYTLPQETHPERLFAINNIFTNKHINETNTKVYDLGCGAHKTLNFAIGVDIRAVTDIQGDITSPPFKANTGHVIVSRHSLEHILDPVKTLKAWTKIIKPNGKIILVLPDHGCINTIDPYYSKGEHLHAYTRESLKELISLFPDLAIAKLETILPLWSFGAVIHKLPTVSIILPTLGREDQLENTLESIINLSYPKHLLELFVINGDETVPNKMKLGLKEATGEYICYAANDMTFHPDCIKNAITDSLKHDKGLVSFNEGNLYPDLGNICTHFVISKDLIKKLDKQEIFSTDFKHTGVDNYLWAQADKLGQALWSENSKITHNHFTKGAQYDDIYNKGWSNVSNDRILLAEKLLKLNLKDVN